MHDINNETFVLASDVLLLLLFHMDKVTCSELWTNVGTSNKPKYIPARKIDELLPRVGEEYSCLSCTYRERHNIHIMFFQKVMAEDLLGKQLSVNVVGANILTDEIVQSVEKFICKAYNLPGDINTVNGALMVLFPTARTPEALPPTSEALHHHIKRARFQTLVWINAHLPQCNSSRSNIFRIQHIST